MGRNAINSGEKIINMKCSKEIVYVNILLCRKYVYDNAIKASNIPAIAETENISVFLFKAK